MVNTSHAARILPQVAEKAIMAACQPKVPMFSIILSFEPTDTPIINKSNIMVYDIVFSVFFRIFKFLNTYPKMIPVNIVPIIVNITVFLFLVCG